MLLAVDRTCTVPFVIAGAQDSMSKEAGIFKDALLMDSDPGRVKKLNKQRHSRCVLSWVRSLNHDGTTPR